MPLRSWSQFALVAVVAMASAGVLAAGKKSPRGVRAMPNAASPTTCTAVIDAVPGALAQALAQAKSGDQLCLAAGEHVGSFAITQSVTLRPQVAGAVVVLRGEGAGAVLRIDADGLAVRLSGLTIRGGRATAGGGLSIFGRGRVQVSDCVFEDNEGGQLGGGGLYARAGHVTIERCTFQRNRGRQGGAVFFDMAMRGELSRCVLQGNHAEWGGALRVAEAAEVTVKVSQFSGNTADDQSTIRISGTRSRTPTLLLDHCQVSDGGLINGPDIAGAVTARASRLPAAWKALLGPRGGNTWQP
jgi:hypothetical protein